jgi:hypothetical protein
LRATWHLLILLLFLLAGAPKASALLSENRVGNFFESAQESPAFDQPQATEWQQENGLSYDETASGRTLGFVDGPNLYTYVRQNPWTSFDAEGLLTMMVNGQEVPWTVGNQARAVVQNMGTVGNAVINYGKSVVNNVKEDGTLAYQGTAVATSGKTTIPQKIAGASVAVAAVADVATSVIPESSVESTVGKTIARDAEKSIGSQSARTIAEDTGKLHQPGYLPDDAPVVRGGGSNSTPKNAPGGNSPEGIAGNTKPVPEGTPGAGLTGFSAQSTTGNAAGMSASDLANGTVKNNSYGATTAGEIRAAGGDPVPTPRDNGSLQGSTHVTVTGLSPETASGLLTPTVKKTP